MHDKCVANYVSLVDNFKDIASLSFAKQNNLCHFYDIKRCYVAINK